MGIVADDAELQVLKALRRIKAIGYGQVVVKVQDHRLMDMDKTEKEKFALN